MSRWLKIAGTSLIVVVVIAGFLVGWAYRTIAQSVALLDGEIEFSELTSAVTMERDALGVATIRGSKRLDVARGLGFLHAQERFFQMDLMRRQAAGELSEIFGAGALEQIAPAGCISFGNREAGDRDDAGERKGVGGSLH